MDGWPDRLKLLAVLSSVKVLLETQSAREGWGGESREGALRAIEGALTYFWSPKGSEAPDLSLEFAPTGRLQELSMANGWGDAFLLLAEQYDRCAHCLTERREE